jgi:hypothetical protein
MDIFPSNLPRNQYRSLPRLSLRSCHKPQRQKTPPMPFSHLAAVAGSAAVPVPPFLPPLPHRALMECAAAVSRACSGVGSRELCAYAGETMLEDLLRLGFGARSSELHGSRSVWPSGVPPRPSLPPQLEPEGRAPLRILSVGCGTGSTVEIPLVEAIVRCRRIGVPVELHAVSAVRDIPSPPPPPN